MLHNGGPTSFFLVLSIILEGTSSCSGRNPADNCVANNAGGGTSANSCESAGGVATAGGGSDAGADASVEFQTSSVCPDGSAANLLWQSTQGAPSGTAGRALFRDVPAAGWLVAFEANGLMRAWRTDNKRGPGPTAWPLLIWVDDSNVVNLGQADDVKFNISISSIHVLEHFSNQLSCENTKGAKNYLNVTVTWDVFGDSDVLVARLKRDLVRGTDGSSLPSSITSNYTWERTKSQFSTSVVDTLQSQVLIPADAGAPAPYVLQNTRSTTGADAATCQNFKGSTFWNTSQPGQAISLTGRTKSECIGIGVNPQQHGETTPNAAIYSEDPALYASGWEDSTCKPCTDDHAAAWLAFAGDVPTTTSTTYFMYSYTQTFDGIVNIEQIVHSLELRAGL